MRYGIKTLENGTVQVAVKDSQLGWLPVGTPHPTKTAAQQFIRCQEGTKENDWIEQALWRTCLSDAF